MISKACVCDFDSLLLEAVLSPLFVANNCSVVYLFEMPGMVLSQTKANFFDNKSQLTTKWPN